ncbi:MULTISPECIES: hypothetical protein [Chitinibacter]|uniref:hypothetical protein n=1 Tax=Chitinibacter TaxID=230666 RepID=UPI00040BD433|nr:MULTISPECIES: hypothetical protein [Chitinibacter]
MNAKMKRLSTRQRKRYLLREAEKVLQNLLVSQRRMPSGEELEAAVTVRYNEILIKS